MPTRWRASCVPAAPARSRQPASGSRLPSPSSALDDGRSRRRRRAVVRLAPRAGRPSRPLRSARRQQRACRPRRVAADAARADERRGRARATSAAARARRPRRGEPADERGARARRRRARRPRAPRPPWAGARRRRGQRGKRERHRGAARGSRPRRLRGRRRAGALRSSARRGVDRRALGRVGAESARWRRSPRRSAARRRGVLGPSSESSTRCAGRWRDAAAFAKQGLELFWRARVGARGDESGRAGLLLGSASIILTDTLAHDKGRDDLF